MRLFYVEACVCIGDVPVTLGTNLSLGGRPCPRVSGTSSQTRPLGTHFFLWGPPLRDVFVPRGQERPLRDKFVPRVTGASPYVCVCMCVIVCECDSVWIFVNILSTSWFILVTSFPIMRGAFVMAHKLK